MKTLYFPKEKAKIFRRLQEIHPACPRRWGKMTPYQIVCHQLGA